MRVRNVEGNGKGMTVTVTEIPGTRNITTEEITIGNNETVWRCEWPRDYSTRVVGTRVIERKSIGHNVEG